MHAHKHTQTVSHTHTHMHFSTNFKQLTRLFFFFFRADFYVLPRKAELNPTKQVNTTFRLTTQPDHVVFLSHVRYLIEESTVSLSACHLTPSEVGRSALEMPSEFLVIVGNDNYEVRLVMSA